MSQTYELNTTAFPRELTAMLAALRSEAAREEKAQQEPPLPNIDWNQFVKLVRHHRVYPQIRGDRDGAGLIPSDVLQALGGDCRQNTWRMLRLSGELDRLCRSLGERGVRSLALKGPALARQLYGDISLRTSKDLDILIPVGDLEKAERLLVELGYEADEPIPRGLGDWKWKIHHVSFTNHETRIQVEVHWRLNGENGKEPSFEALWRDRQACALSDSIFMPGDAHLFMYLVTHGARHGWFRLRWLTDIDRMVGRGLDWDAIVPLLRRYRALDHAGQALVLASGLLHTPIPGEIGRILARGRGPALADRALGFIRDTVVLTTDPSAGEVSRVYKRYLFELKTTRQKWGYAISRLYPSFRDTKALPLPRSLYFLYFPLRPFVWLWRQVRQET